MDTIEINTRNAIFKPYKTSIVIYTRRNLVERRLLSSAEGTRLQFLRTRSEPIVYAFRSSLSSFFLFRFSRKFANHFHFDRCNDKSDSVTAIVRAVEKFCPVSIAYQSPLPSSSSSSRVIDCIDIYIYPSSANIASYLSVRRWITFLSFFLPFPFFFCNYDRFHPWSNDSTLVVRFVEKIFWLDGAMRFQRSKGPSWDPSIFFTPLSGLSETFPPL